MIFAKRSTLSLTSFLKRHSDTKLIKLFKNYFSDKCPWYFINLDMLNFEYLLFSTGKRSWPAKDISFLSIIILAPTKFAYSHFLCNSIFFLSPLNVLAHSSRSVDFESKLSSHEFFQKMNEWIRFLLLCDMFSFFGRNWSQQKDISKLTDL